MLPFGAITESLIPAVLSFAAGGESIGSGKATLPGVCACNKNGNKKNMKKKKAFKQKSCVAKVK